MVFRDVYGEVIWKRIMIIVLVVLLVLSFILYPEVFSFIKISGPGEEPEPKPVEPVAPVKPAEPTIEPGQMVSFSGEVLSDSYECDDLYCMEVILDTGEERLISYTKKQGMYYEGDLITGKGGMLDGEFFAEHIWMEALPEEFE